MATIANHAAGTVVVEAAVADAGTAAEVVGAVGGAGTAVMAAMEGTAAREAVSGAAFRSRTWTPRSRTSPVG